MWLLALLCSVAVARAQDVLPVPPLTAQVIDQTATLDDVQRTALIAKLAAIEQQSGSQIVVLMVPSTQPEDIAAYSQRVGDSWKVGRKDIGDGLLIVVAKNDRRVRIEVAKALEGAIPDLAAKRIIDAQIKPAFRAGDYAGGLNAAIDQLSARIRGEALPLPENTSPTPRAPDSAPSWESLMLFMFIVVPAAGALLTRMMGRKLGALATGGVAGGIGWWVTASTLLAGLAGLAALLLVGVFGVGSARRHGGGFPPPVWGPGHGGWGDGGGGFGGGGFSSGGGGDFGGGGASGEW